MNLIDLLLEEYEHEARHRIAQQNAALPISQGGLGLHKDNTANERASALGFHTKAYHGTPRNFHQFAHLYKGAGSLGKGFYFSTNPKLADEYTGWIDHTTDRHPNILKVLLKGKLMKDSFKLDDTQIHNIVSDSDTRNPYRLNDYSGGKLVQAIGHGFSDFNKMHDSITKHTGYDGVIQSDGRTNKIINIFKPHHIRSVNAAFDPMKKKVMIY